MLRTHDMSLKPTPGRVAVFGRIMSGAAYFNR
jgi:hypothetical protein